MGKHRHVHLNENERIEFDELMKSGTHSARVIGRAWALLLLDRSRGRKRHWTVYHNLALLMA